MDIIEKRKLLYYIIQNINDRNPLFVRSNGKIINVFHEPPLKINITEYLAARGNAYDIEIEYLDVRHQIDIRANGFEYDIFEQTNNNFWGTFDGPMIKMLLG